jgi:phospholipid/cholesterol/gamma-HCH transport system permease protein
MGAAMAAEIGTMRVTEQIDALTTLATNPFQIPRGSPPHRGYALCCRILVLVADIIGVFWGDIWSAFISLGFNPANYLNTNRKIP